MPEDRLDRTLAGSVDPQGSCPVCGSPESFRWSPRRQRWECTVCVTEWLDRVGQPSQQEEGTARHPFAADDARIFTVMCTSNRHFWRHADFGVVCLCGK